jgi:hypothetical protein
MFRHFVFGLPANYVASIFGFVAAGDIARTVYHSMGFHALTVNGAQARPFDLLKDGQAIV